MVSGRGQEWAETLDESVKVQEEQEVSCGVLGMILAWREYGGQTRSELMSRWVSFPLLLPFLQYLSKMSLDFNCFNYLEKIKARRKPYPF